VKGSIAVSVVNTCRTFGFVDKTLHTGNALRWDCLMDQSVISSTTYALTEIAPVFDVLPHNVSINLPAAMQASIQGSTVCSE